MLDADVRAVGQPHERPQRIQLSLRAVENPFRAAALGVAAPVVDGNARCARQQGGVEEPPPPSGVQIIFIEIII